MMDCPHEAYITHEESGLSYCDTCKSWFDLNEPHSPRCVLKTAHMGPCLFVHGVSALPWGYCGTVQL